MEIKVSRAALEAALEAYDAVPEADRVCRPCQSSDFRARVLVKAVKAKRLWGEKKKGVALSETAGVKIEMFLAGALKAEMAYEYDERGDIAFRNWCLEAHRALNVAAAFEEARGLLGGKAAGKAPETETETETEKEKEAEKEAGKDAENAPDGEDGV